MSPLIELLMHSFFQVCAFDAPGTKWIRHWILRGRNSSFRPNYPGSTRGNIPGYNLKSHRAKPGGLPNLVSRFSRSRGAKHQQALQHNRALGPQTNTRHLWVSNPREETPVAWLDDALTTRPKFGGGRLVFVFPRPRDQTFSKQTFLAPISLEL